MISTRRLNVLVLGILTAAAAALGACAAPAAQECGATGIFCPSGTHCAAAQGICLPDTNTCGNAHLDPGEVCDDGNTKDGDGCSHDCMSDEKCGNGIVDVTALVPEVCDDGNTADGDGCSHDCLSKEKCGNGIKDVNEECDDGNAESGDGCSPRCTIERCGNGIPDPGEACDLLPIDTTRCSEDCKSTRMCGNGIVDPGEECDNGPLNNNNADCRADCVFNRCGDGFKNTLGSPGHPEHEEACDDAPHADPFSRRVTPTESAGCNIDCTPSSCGDGKTNATAGEECDSGGANSNSGDCRLDCVLNRCGDGFVDSTGSHREACDPATQASSGSRALNPTETSTCNLDCTAASCGDHVINRTRGEECDDGAANNLASNNCTDECKENVCGDGKKDTQAPRIEQCDDGNTDNSDGCSNACTSPSCGNNIVDLGEECDDGNTDDKDGCTNACAFARCGDGIIQTGVEQCDDGNTNNNDGCSSTCRNETCGNNIVDPGEECDNGAANSNSGDCRLDCVLNRCGDGFPDTTGSHREACDPATPVSAGSRALNPTETSTCNLDCTAASCGDHVINRTRGEECDDGTPNNLASNNCTDVCKKNVCGDGKKDTQAPRIEQCDDGNTNNNDGCSNACTSPSCGNNIVDQGEECDDGNSDDKDGCTNGCVFARCGDGITQTGVEDCDDGASNGAPGDHCSADCHVETCGNGVIDPNELCDDGNPLTCGACDSTCQIVAPAAAATGLIISGSGTDFTAAETFTIRDGLGGTSSTVIFTFVTTTPVGPQIKLDPALDDIGMAQLITDAINSSGLQIDAVHLLNTAVITLTHRVKTVNGTQAMTNGVTHAPGASHFVMAGMTGGHSGDCGNTTGCTVDDDCASDLCVGGTCKACTANSQCATNRCLAGSCRECRLDADCGGAPGACKTDHTCR